jgi:hypothetical protein
MGKDTRKAEPLPTALSASSVFKKVVRAPTFTLSRDIVDAAVAEAERRKREKEKQHT